MDGRTVGVILDRFVEGLFNMMLDHHRAHVVEMDLTIVQAQTLALLRAAPSPSTRLAGSLGITAPAMTQLTDRLVRKRLIERRSTEGDRRAVIIELTTQGKLLVDRFRKRRSEVFEDALMRLEETDRLGVIDALSKVVGALEGHREGKARPVDYPVHPRRFAGRTAAQPTEASNEVGGIPVVPPVRRMKIEWD